MANALLWLALPQKRCPSNQGPQRKGGFSTIHGFDGINLSSRQISPTSSRPAIPFSVGPSKHQAVHAIVRHAAILERKIEKAKPPVLSVLFHRNKLFCLQRTRTQGRMNRIKRGFIRPCFMTLLQKSREPQFIFLMISAYETPTNMRCWCLDARCTYQLQFSQRNKIAYGVRTV